MSIARVQQPPWTNWVGNQSFVPRQRTAAASEAAVVAAVRHATSASSSIRCAGSGHSFGPVIETAGTLLELSAMRGVVDVDVTSRRVRVLPGTLISDFGDRLWDNGLALHNQGDIDTQTVAGVVATGTHGSGVHQRSFSGMVRAMRLVSGTGDVLDIDERQLDLLHAAQVALGTLGVITEVELEVVPAYGLAEYIGYMDYDEAVREWPDAIRRHRHFSFFWMPTDKSASLYGLPDPEGTTSAGRCFVKTYDRVNADASLANDHTGANRVDRSYRIYPHTFDPNFHELEYMVPLQSGLEAAEAVRQLILTRFPHCIFPMEVRTTAADGAFLSPNYGTDTVAISVSGEPGTDYWPFLRAVDETLRPFRARPHWGKLHFLDRRRMEELFPRFDRFVEIRRELDPKGIFLNEHTRELLE